MYEISSRLHDGFESIFGSAKRSRHVESRKRPNHHVPCVCLSEIFLIFLNFLDFFNVILTLADVSNVNSVFVSLQLFRPAKRIQPVPMVPGAFVCCRRTVTRNVFVYISCYRRIACSDERDFRVVRQLE